MGKLSDELLKQEVEITDEEEKKKVKTHYHAVKTMAVIPSNTGSDFIQRAISRLSPDTTQRQVAQMTPQVRLAIKAQSMEQDYKERYEALVTRHEEHIRKLEEKLSEDKAVITPDKALAHLRAARQVFARDLEALNTEYMQFVANVEKASEYVSNPAHKEFFDEHRDQMDAMADFLLNPKIEHRDIKKDTHLQELSEPEQKAVQALIDHDPKMFKDSKKANDSPYDHQGPKMDERKRELEAFQTLQKQNLDVYLSHVEEFHKEQKRKLLEDKEMRSVYENASLFKLAKEQWKGNPEDFKKEAVREITLDHPKGAKIQHESTPGSIVFKIDNKQHFEDGGKLNYRQMSHNERKDVFKQTLATMREQGCERVWCNSTNPKILREFYKEAIKAGYRDDQIQLARMYDPKSGYSERARTETIATSPTGWIRENRQMWHNKPRDAADDIYRSILQRDIDKSEARAAKLAEKELDTELSTRPNQETPSATQTTNSSSTKTPSADKSTKQNVAFHIDETEQAEQDSEERKTRSGPQT